MARKRSFQSLLRIEVVAIIVVLLLVIIGLYFENVSLKNKIEVLELEVRWISDIKDKLLQFVQQQIMEGQVPIDQIISPFPLGPPGEKIENLEIRFPRDGSEVSAQFYVEGVTPDTTGNLWVIIHPIATAIYQVQPKVTVWRDGTWRVKIPIDKTGGISAGKPFEIMAVVNPTVPLKEGDVLTGWPEAQWRSQVVEVIKK